VCVFLMNLIAIFNARVCVGAASRDTDDPGNIVLIN
jgi:hypothetical protein